MKGTRSVGRAVLLVLPMAILAACGGDDTSEPPPAPANAPAAAPSTAAPAAPASELAAQGQLVFSGPGLCFSCHGPAGQGTALGPNLTDDTWIWIENPQTDLAAKIVDQVRTGTPQPREFPAPMPPMGGAALTDEQLQAVAAYVASL